MNLTEQVLDYVEQHRSGSYISIPGPNSVNYWSEDSTGRVRKIRFQGEFARGYKWHTRVIMDASDLITECSSYTASPKLRFGLWSEIPVLRDRVTFSKGHIKYVSPLGNVIFFDRILTLTGAGEGYGDVSLNDVSLNARKVSKIIDDYCTAAVTRYVTETHPPLLEWTMWWTEAQSEPQKLWHELTKEQAFNACWLYSTVFAARLQIPQDVQFQLALMAKQPHTQRMIWLSHRPDVRAVLQNGLEREFKARVKTGVFVDL